MNEINEIGRIVDDLKQEVVLYNELYSDTESIKVLKEHPQAFSIIKHSMLYSIVMRIAALFDPAETSGRANLTIKRLTERMEQTVVSEMEQSLLSENNEEEGQCSKELRKKLECLIELKVNVNVLQEKYKKTNIKAYRNRLGAHNDVVARSGQKKYLNKAGERDAVKSFIPKDAPKVQVSFESLSELLEGTSHAIALAASIYSGLDRDQFLVRKTGMPSTAGGKRLLQALDARHL